MTIPRAHFYFTLIMVTYLFPDIPLMCIKLHSFTLYWGHEGFIPLIKLRIRNPITFFPEDSWEKYLYCFCREIHIFLLSLKCSQSNPAQKYLGSDIHVMKSTYLWMVFMEKSWPVMIWSFYEIHTYLLLKPCPPNVQISDIYARHCSLPQKSFVFKSLVVVYLYYM